MDADCGKFLTANTTMLEAFGVVDSGGRVDMFSLAIEGDQTVRIRGGGGFHFECGVAAGRKTECVLGDGTELATVTVINRPNGTLRVTAAGSLRHEYPWFWLEVRPAV